MMSLEAESFSRDAIIQALIEIDVKFSGRYYTIEEISEITGGVPVDKLETLLNSRSSSPFWSKVFIQIPKNCA